jgi:hypothetical protein
MLGAKQAFAYPLWMQSKTFVSMFVVQNKTFV